MERATVRVTGVVQSVGFRPFVYRRAVARDLRGTVRNLGDAGVRIELEGASDGIDAFLANVRERSPPLASVETVQVDRKHVVDPEFETFEIVESAGGDGGGGTIPPDTAICDQCLVDVRDPQSRYHDYWATSCVDCGPRFTVVESLPFDRLTSSMATFPMCDACREEYEDPADRRYHAQTIACPNCGPTLRYGRLSGGDGPRSDDTSSVVTSSADSSGPVEGRDPFPDELEEPADGREAIDRAAEALVRGETVVLKGIGGAHLACDATDDDAVRRLRERTGRPAKPFAVMAPDIDAARSFADLSESERGWLQSPRRPILLVERTPFSTESNGDDGNGRLAPGVAPGLHTVGVMFPYSGVHHLLFDEIDVPLVMTSANLPGKPMLTANGPLVDGLVDVADGVLLHDRRIVARCDDSVARVVDVERRLVRRSRGFTPIAVPLEGVEPGSTAVLGTGPELDVTAGVLHEGDCYLTQYVGDVDDLETVAYFEGAVDHLLDVTGLDSPPIVAHDAHPGFNTTDYARRLATEDAVEHRVAVQHHHAHAASVLAEHGRERAIALTLDGVGYGPDGTVWGGEVLDASPAHYDRVGGLAPVPMPGGDRATRHPARLTAGLLYAHDSDAVVPTLERHDVTFPDGDEERDLVRQQLAAGVNTPATSSAGRFLDAVSALLGVCSERRYEGEPAMKLEAAAADGAPIDVDVPTTQADDRPVVDTPTCFARLVELVEEGRSRADVAATAQDALARGLTTLAVDAAHDRNCDAVALTGGVAYNDHVAARIRERVTDAGLTFLGNERVPPGDGGVAYGQVAVAAARTSQE